MKTLARRGRASLGRTAKICVVRLALAGWISFALAEGMIRILRLQGG
jgi:hypothetical protein